MTVGGAIPKPFWQAHFLLIFPFARPRVGEISLAQPKPLLIARVFFTWAGSRGSHVQARSQHFLR